MTPSQTQQFVADRLAGLGLTLMFEVPDDATADELAAYDQQLEANLAASGLVLIVLPRQVDFAAAARRAGRLGLQALVPVAIVENPAVNRRPGGANRGPLRVAEEVVAALLCDLVTLGEGAVLNPMQHEGGLFVSWVLPRVACTIDASGDQTPGFVPPPAS